MGNWINKSLKEGLIKTYDEGRFAQKLISDMEFKELHGENCKYLFINNLKSIKTLIPSKYYYFLEKGFQIKYFIFLIIQRDNRVRGVSAPGEKS